MVGPSAWLAEDMRSRSDEWLYQLDEGDLEEVGELSTLLPRYMPDPRGDAVTAVVLAWRFRSLEPWRPSSRPVWN